MDHMPRPAVDPAVLRGCSGPWDAVVVGSGPNGLLGALTLARRGMQVLVLEAEATPGGGARTLDLGLADGVVHDVCSAVHPLALASPAIGAQWLRARGVDMIAPEASYAHPLDGGRAAVAMRSAAATGDLIGGRRGRVWADVFSSLAAHGPDVMALMLGTAEQRLRAITSPTGARTAALLGRAAALADRSVRSGDDAGALLAGVGAHAISPLSSPTAIGTAVLLGSLAHTGGWPIPRGGSQSLVTAWIAELSELGGSVVTHAPVTSLDQLPPSRVVVLDLPAPSAGRLLAPWARSAASRRLTRRLQVFPPSAGAAAKADLVLSGPIPWAAAQQAPGIARAGTVHLGGSATLINTTEREVAEGRLPEAPVVLVSDPAGADPSREVRGLRPVWAYAHVPLGCPVDPVPLVLAQLERFAPGVRDLVVAARGVPASRMTGHNRSLTGGDIAGGSTALPHLAARPFLATDPHHLATLPGWAPGGEDAEVLLCSASSAPGPGVHGLGGQAAARSALARLA